MDALEALLAPLVLEQLIGRQHGKEEGVILTTFFTRSCPQAPVDDVLALSQVVNEIQRLHAPIP
ncbi:hypothetical protein D3C85_1664230 [compost metagenome]